MLSFYQFQLIKKQAVTAMGLQSILSCGGLFVSYTDLSWHPYTWYITVSFYFFIIKNAAKFPLLPPDAR